jgi:hypothetical protein
MQENLSSILKIKLYNVRSIYVGTFLGGPLVAGYLIATNFKKLGQESKVTVTWIIAILVTIIILGVVFLIPNIEKIPPYIIPIFYGLLAQYLAQKFQGTAIKSHVERGAPLYSVWRAVWIGLVGCAILVGIIFTFLLVTYKEAIG